MQWIKKIESQLKKLQLTDFVTNMAWYSEETNIKFWWEKLSREESSQN